MARIDTRIEVAEYIHGESKNVHAHGGCHTRLFNKISLLRLRVDHSRCLSCGNCSRACPVELDVPKEANSPECIRCLKCVKACDAVALDYQFPLHRTDLPAAPAGGPEPVPARDRERGCGVA